MPSTVTNRSVETEGNKVSTCFQVDDVQRLHARFWQEVVAEADLQDKDIYGLLEWSKGHYSKVASGQQGDLLGMVLRIGITRPDLRRAFVAKLAEHEQLDPVSLAAEALSVAAIRFLRLRRDVFHPRPAKASLKIRAKAGAV